MPQDLFEVRHVEKCHAQTLPGVPGEPAEVEVRFVSTHEPLTHQLFEQFFEAPSVHVREV